MGLLGNVFTKFRQGMNYFSGATRTKTFGDYGIKNIHTEKSALKNSSFRILYGDHHDSNFMAANRFNRAHGRAGGYGAWSFSNIMSAHCTPEDIVEEFGLNKEDNAYGCDAYLEAYQEEWDEAAKEYDDLMCWYQDAIEMNEGEIRELQEQIAEKEAEIEELIEQIEELEDELSMCDSIEDAIDIMEQINECIEHINELQAEIEELEEAVIVLQEEIDGLRSEMEFYSIEEDFMDFDEVDKKAMEYGAEWVMDWYDGAGWIPEEVLDWAYYDISDHNG